MKDVGSERELRDLRQKELLLRSQIEHADNPVFESEKRLDKRIIHEQLNKVRAQIGTLTPPKITDAEKDKLYAKAKRLESEIQEGMPTRDEMMGRAVTVQGNPVGGRRAIPEIVNKHLAWQAANEKKVREWKNIMRQIDPETLNSSNVERLRK